MLDAFNYIFQKVAEHEQAEQKKQNDEIKQEQRKRGKSGAASPRSTRIRNR